MCGAAALATPLVIGRRSRAAERSITVGIYSGKQGDYVRKEIFDNAYPDFRGVLKKYAEHISHEGISHQLEFLRGLR